MKEAETARLLENTYRHINIALVNEMARFCHEREIDLWDVIRCAATKPFGFQAFFPGPGVGGHCIPIDPTTSRTTSGPSSATRSAPSSSPRRSTPRCRRTSRTVLKISSTTMAGPSMGVPYYCSV